MDLMLRFFLVERPAHICAIGSINSHYFHIIGDGHQPNSRGL